LFVFGASGLVLNQQKVDGANIGGRCWLGGGAGAIGGVPRSAGAGVCSGAGISWWKKPWSIERGGEDVLWKRERRSEWSVVKGKAPDDLFTHAHPRARQAGTAWHNESTT
jgi:hypothetical protein